MSNKLTIVIPTHERQHILARAINYYEFYNYKIIIVDSSNKKLNYDFKDNFLYFHFPGCKFCLKIHKIINFIQTDFVSVCPDDDFLINNFLQTAIYNLVNKKELSSIKGTSVKFKINNNKLYFNKFKKINKKFKKNQFAKIYSNFPNLIYSVMKKQILIDTVSISKDFDFITLFEWIMPMLAIKLGDVEIIEDINILRDDTRYSDYFESDNTPYFKQKTKNIHKFTNIRKTDYVITNWYEFFNSKQGIHFKQNMLIFFTENSSKSLELKDINTIINNYIFKKNNSTYFDKLFLIMKNLIKKIFKKKLIVFSNKNKSFAERKIGINLNKVSKSINQFKINT